MKEQAARAAQVEGNGMKPLMTMVAVLLGMVLAANAGADEGAKQAALRLVLSEVQAGAMGSEQYCILVFDDHRFHAEKAHSIRGKVQERRAYQGQLSDGDWNTLTAILDAKQFRELHVPAGTPALVVNDSHPYTISVARQNGFQNMEFLTKESLKPYESELKPLLQWWKSARNLARGEPNTDADSRCSLSDTVGVFSN
jgi:hypothetical protein